MYKALYCNWETIGCLAITCCKIVELCPRSVQLQLSLLPSFRGMPLILFTMSHIFEPVCFKVIQSPRGRGKQLNAGWSKATGDWVLFLHADTLLPDGYGCVMQQHISEHHEARWGCFEGIRTEVYINMCQTCALWKGVQQELHSVVLTTLLQEGEVPFETLPPY